MAPLHRFHHLNLSSAEFPGQLIALLHERGYKDNVKSLQHDDSVWLAEYLDNVLNVDVNTRSPIGPALFRKCLIELSSPNIAGWPIASRGPFNTYEGHLGDLKVRVKRLQNYSTVDPEQAKHAFRREAVIWKHLVHPNVAPLMGVTVDPFQFVTTWMPGGELPEYIITNPSIDRLRLLSDIAAGLDYLHFHDVIHGDLKGPSILVDGTGRACLTDFGLAAITPDFGSAVSMTNDHAARWTAPEILDMELPVTKASDVYSFAMVIYEVFSGMVPFHDMTPAAAAVGVSLGKRPERPSHPSFTDNLWDLTEHCWSQKPQHRPEISRVIPRLRATSLRRGHMGGKETQAAENATVSNSPRWRGFWFSRYEACRAATHSSPAKRGKYGECPG